jgi:hypothetical protein
MKGVYSDRHMDSSVEGGSNRVTRCGSGAKMRAAETFAAWSAKKISDNPGVVFVRARRLDA